MATLDYRRPQKRVRTYEDEQATRQWLVPVIMLGACAVLWMGVAMVQGGVRAGAVLGIGYLVAVIIEAVLALIAAYIVAAFGIGFGELWMGLLKLAAIVMVATTIAAPFGCAGIFIYIGALVVMLTTMLDLERWEAGVFVAVLIAVHIAFRLLALEAIRGMLA
jgi:hypothetical protein